MFSLFKRRLRDLTKCPAAAVRLQVLGVPARKLRRCSAYLHVLHGTLLLQVTDEAAQISFIDSCTYEPCT